MEGQWECKDMMEPRRARGVHALMVKLFGRCTCGSERPRQLYTVAGARTAESEERVNA